MLSLYLFLHLAVSISTFQWILTRLSWCNMFSGDIPSVMITPPSTGSWSLSGATLLGLDFVSVKRDPITAIELKSCACNINGNWETTKTDLLLRQIDEFAFLFQRTHWTTWLRGKAPTCCGVRCLWKISSNLNYCHLVSCLLSCSQPILHMLSTKTSCSLIA